MFHTKMSGGTICSPAWKLHVGKGVGKDLFLK